MSSNRKTKKNAKYKKKTNKFRKNRNINTKQTKRSLQYGKGKSDDVGIEMIDMSDIPEMKKRNLIRAVENNNISEVKKLLKEKVDLNNYVHGATPLFFAVMNDNAKLTELLLEHGANPNIRYKKKETPLLLALMKDNLKIAELLLKHGANPNIKHVNGRTPLYVAVRDNKPEVVKLLLDHDADPNIQDENGDTPLHYATSLRNMEDIISLLLSNGADLTIENNRNINSDDFLRVHYGNDGADLSLGRNIYNDMIRLSEEYKIKQPKESNWKARKNVLSFAERMPDAKGHIARFFGDQYKLREISQFINPKHRRGTEVERVTELDEETM